MLFPTFSFAVFFITVFYLHWWLIGFPRLRKWILLLGSLFFYGFWSWKFAGMLVASAVLNHLAAAYLERSSDARARKRMMVFTVLANLATLGFFKYTRFLTVDLVLPVIRPFFVWTGHAELLVEGVDVVLPLIDEIVLPVGISFFTFQAMSYVLDVYWRKIQPARSVLDFANYLAFFPQLVAGPIVRASDLLPQMEVMPTRQVSLQAPRAATLILVGLFKKMIVANWLSAHLADPVFANPAAYSGWDILLGVYGYTLQIYCDFSGYSDIAIGVALLMGYHFPINFNAPYFSVTLQEFWRRWHISLSTWLRDYLYIPLGGSRHGHWRTRVNLFLTFLLGGLWHGAGWTFILWGAFHGIYLSLERIVRAWFGLPEKPSSATAWPLAIVGRFWIFHVVAFSWILFRSQDMETVRTILSGLLGCGRAASQLISAQAVTMLLVGYGIQWIDGDRLCKFWEKSERVPVAVLAVLAAFLLIVILALAPQGVMPFIYFQF